MMNGSSTDLGSTPDAGTGPVIVASKLACGSASCSGDALCCIDVTTGQTATMTCEPKQMCMGIAATCTESSECGGGVCCANIDLSTMGSSLQVTGGTADCKASASCLPSAELTDNSSGVVLSTKLCSQASECADFTGMTPFGNQAFDGCCARPEAPDTHFCAPASFASTFGYSCL